MPAQANCQGGGCRPPTYSPKGAALHWPLVAAKKSAAFLARNWPRTLLGSNDHACSCEQYLSRGDRTSPRRLRFSPNPHRPPFRASCSHPRSNPTLVHGRAPSRTFRAKGRCSLRAPVASRLEDRRGNRHMLAAKVESIARKSWDPSRDAQNAKLATRTGLSGCTRGPGRAGQWPRPE